ncbi:MAG TPA: PEP-utilizing enzyme [Dehalococcoidia bacterium]|nr:PEP-utilizing enzyme [Dehalococcoidia bacterium]
MTNRERLVDEDRGQRWRLERFSVAVHPLYPLDISLRQTWFRALRNDAIAFGKETFTDYRVVNGYVYTRTAPTSLSPAERGRRSQAFKDECLRFLRHGSSYWQEVSLPEIEANLDRLRRFPAKLDDQMELAGHLREAVAVYERHWEIHWHLGSEFAIQRFLDSHRELLHGSEEDARSLLRGVPTMSSRLVDELRNMARIARADEAAADAVRRGRVPASPEFVGAFERFLETYGLRTGAGFGSTTTIAEPTWIEYPRPVLRLIAAYMDAGESKLFAAPPATSGASKLGRARAKRYQQELEAARAASGLLEDHNYYIEQTTGGLLRHAVMRLASALQTSRHLEDKNDVFFLYLNELINAPLVPPELTRDRVVEHRHQYDVWGRSDPPDELGGEEPSQLVLGDASRPRGEVNLLQGVPASQGTVTAQAHVALDDESVPDVEPGEILVARNAGPLWSPVLPLLGGLVLDEGAILQHAALLAREYGVPAVFMTGNATTAIPDGALVTVDGSAGTVRIESPSPVGAPAASHSAAP